MVDYLHEKNLFDRDDVKILYHNETELGVEYIVQDEGKFIKVLYNKMKLVSKSDLTVNELFTYLSKGLKFAKLICRFVKFEIFIGALILSLVGLDFSLSELFDIFINKWLWFVIGVSVIPRRKSFIVDMFKIVVSSLYMVNLFSGVLLIYDYGVFIRFISILLCFMYIVLNVFLYGICENECQLYDDIKNGYF